MTTKPKIGIALGGGAARGWAHIGVLKALVDAGFAPDIVAGTSIGAVAGGCYVAGKLDPLETFARSLTRRRVFGFLDFNFAGSGLITGQRLCDRFEEHLEHVSIEDFERKFVAVATELGTGHEIWLNKGRLVDAMHASYALPGIFRPVKINGRWLIDGALVNPIPVSVCRALGARIVIAVNLHWDVFGKGAVIHDQEAIDETQEGPEQTRPPKGNGRAALHLLHRQFFGGENSPGISTVMMDAFNIIQDRIARSRLAGDPPDVSISPELGDIGLFEFHRAGEAIPCGAEATERELGNIQRVVRALAA
ncbi:MAG: patatin-like phospholipase family protein [Methyloligellaceae bacterium]